MSKGRNAQLENFNIRGTKSERRKRYREIAQELGARHITLSDIANNFDDGEKLPGFLDMMDKEGMTMDEVVVLQQYAKAIVEKDTKSAEFLRDTAGDSPKTQIDINNVSESGLSKLSEEELRSLLAGLELEAKKGKV